MTRQKPQTRPVPVMQVTDSLIAGGAERMAVNLANLLPRERYAVHLGVTRHEGPLAAELAEDVGRIVLHRGGRRDEPAALLRFSRYLREHGIRLLHCHKDTIFFASLASLFPPFPRILWHDHFGSYAVRERPAWLYKLGTRRVAGVIAVNRFLAEWSVSRLGFPKDRVWYLPNFVRVPQGGARIEGLPGTSGYRLVCVCNVRPQKDLVNLARAMARVVEEEPRAHALVVGEVFDPDYFARVRAEVAGLGLDRSISFLGGRTDVAAILRSCDVGVLSSASEGLPLALIEYGMAGLASAATRVGQCPEVLSDGALGALVPPGDAEALAQGILGLLRASDERTALGERFRRHVLASYGESRAIARVCDIYAAVLGERGALSSPDRCSPVETS
jgi:glycosyltransferase involved in cell wall biosynthesis